MTALWSIASVFIVIAMHSLSGCMTKITPIEPTLTIANVTIPTHPHCSVDRRGQYSIIEVPAIIDTAQAPPAFFPILREAIMEEGRHRDIYRVVPATQKQDEVVQLMMFVESWTPKTEQGEHNGILSMKLFLIDKKHRCQIGKTTGHGEIQHASTTGFNPEAIRTIAESAGWFVGMTLMHDP